MGLKYYLYDIQPRAIKYIIGIIYREIPNSVLYGKVYRTFRRELKIFENKSLIDKEIFLVNKIKKLLIDAYENTDFYKELFDNKGFRPYDFCELEQMENIPIIDKEMVMNNIDKFIIKKYRNSNKLEKVTTGGTSGKQMVFFQEKKYTAVRCKAYFDYLFQKEGYNKRCKLAVIRNNVMPKEQLWEEDYLNNKCIFNPFILTDENIKKIIAKLNKDKIMYFHAYPSSLMILAEYMKRTGDRLQYKPKAIFASSENIYEGQREIIEEFFNCSMHIHYGHSENGAVAGWCLYRSHYHIEDCFGYCELLDDRGKVVSKYEEWGQIVTTGFNNGVMPLIRYATGDYAQYVSSDQCENYRCLSKIQGRWLQEMLYTEKGNGISMTAINVHSDIFDHVKAYQFYQDTLGKCDLCIVKGASYKLEDEKAILEEMSKRLGTELQIHIKYVDEIKKEKNGKFKYIVQKI